MVLSSCAVHVTPRQIPTISTTVSERPSPGASPALRISLLFTYTHIMSTVKHAILATIINTSTPSDLLTAASPPPRHLSSALQLELPAADLNTRTRASAPRRHRSHPVMLLFVAATAPCATQRIFEPILRHCWPGQVYLHESSTTRMNAIDTQLC